MDPFYIQLDHPPPQTSCSPHTVSSYPIKSSHCYSGSSIHLRNMRKTGFLRYEQRDVTGATSRNQSLYILHHVDELLLYKTPPFSCLYGRYEFITNLLLFR